MENATRLPAVPAFTMVSHPAAVLIVSPQGRDAQVASTILARAGVVNRPCPSLEALCSEMDEDTGLLIIAEEAIQERNILLLADKLRQQPLWSELPIVILTSGRSSQYLSDRSATARLADVLGNIIFLERPLHTLTLVSTVLSGLKARSRQFELRDYIVESQRVAEELRASEHKLAESNRELERFATIVSHDLQAPLRKVIFFTDYLATRMSGVLTGEHREYFNRIQRSVEHMQQLIKDLLLLSRATRNGVAFERVHLDTLLSAVLDELHLDIAETGGCIERGTLGTIHADPKQIHQLLVNLIGNSLKYHKPGVAPFIRVYGEKSPQGFQLVVQDNGIGIAPQYHARIFEIFQRLHGPNDYCGTGIGLAIVRRIAERHGGTVRIESQLNAGARFIVELPQAGHKADQPAGLARKQRNPSGPTLTQYHQAE